MKSILRHSIGLVAAGLLAAACFPGGGGGSDTAGTDIDDTSSGEHADSATGQDDSATNGRTSGNTAAAVTVVGRSTAGSSAAGAAGTPVSVGGTTTVAGTPTGADQPKEAATTSSPVGAQSSTTADGTSTTAASASTTAPPTTQRTTTAPPATQAPTTRPATSAPSGGGGGYFATLPPGSSLPSGDACAGRVKSRPEIRPGNAGYNNTRGTSANGRYPRVDGNFTGTTDEIIQWAACKWGIDEDWVRAQTAKESWWDMTAGGDLTSDQSECHPTLRTGGGQCPESVGLLQVRFLYHSEAFEDTNAIRSSAYNIDYAYAAWRECYEGGLRYLNDVQRGAEYVSGDLEGCLGVWFSGRWYTDRAVTYIADVRALRQERIWEQSRFQD